MDAKMATRLDELTEHVVSVLDKYPCPWRAESEGQEGEPFMYLDILDANGRRVLTEVAVGDRASEMYTLLTLITHAVNSFRIGPDTDTRTAYRQGYRDAQYTSLERLSSALERLFDDDTPEAHCD
jgi:hypothetical protein